jgi:hypothetical protein
MTYEESAALMTDTLFRARVKVACLKYAHSIMNEANTVPAHNTRLKWATSVIASPDTVAQQIQPSTVMDSAVQLAGADLQDPSLQGAVESVFNKML